MGKVNSKDKGKRGEREVAELLRAHGFEARRGVQYQGSPESPDVVGLPGWHIEVKRTERLQLWKAWYQAEKESACEERPVVITRSNRTSWLAILDLQDFLLLVKDDLRPHTCPRCGSVEGIAPGQDGGNGEPAHPKEIDPNPG